MREFQLNRRKRQRKRARTLVIEKNSYGLNAEVISCDKLKQDES